MDDQTYAVSMYVDLRLGLLSREDKIMSPDDANRVVATRYGQGYANRAQELVDGDTRRR